METDDKNDHSVVFFYRLPDGTYFVDPNGGNVEDAIEVVCRKLPEYSGWFTCVPPSMTMIVSLAKRVT